MSAGTTNHFKVVQLNAENLFLFLDDLSTRDWQGLSEKDWQKLSHATVGNKSLLKTRWLAESLLLIDADLICLNEVGGWESLVNFGRYFLKDLYTPYLIEGNSDRGIDVGYLVRKTLPLRAELRTHKNRPIQFLYPHELQTNLFHQDQPEKIKKSHYFSRDCSELRLYRDGQTQPALVVLLVHLKSKLDPENIDPQGKDRRRAEMNTLMQIYREVRAEFTPAVPVIVTGDFNGCARRDQLAEEFTALVETDLHSVLELVGHRDEQACTQIQFNRGGAPAYLQLDFIFVSPELQPHLVHEEVEVFRWRSDLGVVLPLPRTLDQRLALPSDHFPVVAAFKDFI